MCTNMKFLFLTHIIPTGFSVLEHYCHVIASLCLSVGVLVLTMQLM